MATVYACQHCSQLPPPPPLFSLSPPPNIRSIDVRCSLRSPLSSSRSPGKVTASSPSVSVALGIVSALLITTMAILLIKNRLVKRRRRQGRRTKCTATTNVSSSIKFNGQNNHHHHPNSPKFLPLLSDSCSSDQMSSTPPSEYPCGVLECLVTNDVQHEYEQITYDHPSSDYCLVYCRQCANYHQTPGALCRRPSLTRPPYLPLSTNAPCQPACKCHLRTFQHYGNARPFERQPMLEMRMDEAFQPSGEERPTV